MIQPIEPDVIAPVNFRQGDETWTKYRARAQTDLFWFASVVLGYGELVPMTIGAHGLLCKFVERQTGVPALDTAKYRKINLARGWGKSTIVTRAYAMQRLLRNPNTAILLANEREQTAADFLAEIKSHFETNEFLRALFPEIIPENVKQTIWTASRIAVNRTRPRPEPSIAVIGVGGTVTGSHPDCLAPWQEIITSQGLVAAANLKRGHRVLSHEGRFDNVQAVASRQYDGELVGLQTWHTDVPVWLTPEHKVLAQTMNDGLPCVEWRAVGTLKRGDVVVSPRIAATVGSRRLLGPNQGAEQALLGNSETWWILGLWLAEGCATPQKNGVRFSLNRSETDIAAKIVLYAKQVLKVHAYISELAWSLQVGFTHGAFKALTAKCGTHAVNKYVPAFAIQAGFGDISLLLDGYYVGDGCWRDTYRVATTASRSLAVGIATLERRLGRPATVRSLRQGYHQQIIRGKPARSGPSWSIIADYDGNPTGKPRRGWADSQFWYTKVRRIERRQYQGLVYDAQVKNARSMTAPWVAIHNCIIVDDAISRAAMENARSGSWDIMHQVNRWIHQLVPLLNPNAKPFPEILFIGTPWFHSDCYSHIDDHFGYGEHPVKYALRLRLPDGQVQQVICSRVGDLAIFRRPAIEDGRSAFPEKWSLEDLAKIQMGDQLLFSANYLLNPSDSASAVFKLDWLREFEWIDEQRMVKYVDAAGATKRQRVADLDTLLFFDPGGFGGRSVDQRARAAICVTGSTGAGEHLLLETYSEADTLLAGIRKLATLATRYNPRKLVLQAEDQDALLDVVRTTLAEQGCTVPIELMPATTRQQEQHILQLEPWFQRGHVYVGPGAAFQEFRTQYSQFPRAARFDLLKALAYAPAVWKKHPGGAHLTTEERRAQELSAYRARRGLHV